MLHKKENIDINKVQGTLVINLKEYPSINQLIFSGEDKKSYVIIPSIHLPSRNVSEKKMKRYKKVKIGFEYNSDKNNDFLNEKKVRKL